MLPFTHATDTSSTPYKDATTPVNHSSFPSTSTTPTFSREKEGPRKKDEGINDTQTQGIISVESDNTGGTILRITLLAAGFIIGPGGATIRDISTRFNVDIRSSNQTFQSCKVRSLHITAPNDHQAVQAACSVIAQGVDHYNSLTGGAYVNCYVDREQVVGGITFYYSPPPKHAVAHAAMLITPHPKANSPPSPSSLYNNNDKNSCSSSSSCCSKAKMATTTTPPPPPPTTTPPTPAALSYQQYGYDTPSPSGMSPHPPSSPRTASNSGTNTPINIDQITHKIRANSALSRASTITTNVYAPSFTGNNQANDFTQHHHRRHNNNNNILDFQSIIIKEEGQQHGYGEEHQQQLVSSSPHLLPSITPTTTPPTQPALVILPVIMNTSSSSTNHAASVTQSVIQALKETFPDAAICNPYHSNSSTTNAAAAAAATTIIDNTFSVLTLNDNNKENDDDNSDDVFTHSPLRSVLNTLGLSPSKPISEQPAEECKNKRESHHHQVQQQLQYPDHGHHHHHHHHHQYASLHQGEALSPQFTAATTTHLDRRVYHRNVGGGHFPTAGQGHGHGMYDGNEGEEEEVGEWTATPCPSPMASPCRTEDNCRGRGDEAVLSKYGFPSYGQFARQNPFYNPQF